MQANAAKKAASEQGRAAERSLEEQQRQYNLARRDAAPWMSAGKASLSRMRELLGISPQQMGGGGGPLYGSSLVDISSGVPAPNSDLYETSPEYRKAWDEVAANHYSQYSRPYIAGSDPRNIEEAVRGRLSPELFAAPTGAASSAAAGATEGFGDSELLRKFTEADFYADPVAKLGFDFGLREGSNAINARAIAGGGYDSGATLKALTRYGSDYGSTKANESYNRFVQDQANVYNKLAGVSGTGQVASQQTQAAGQNYANQASEAMAGAANARAAGIVGGANAWGGAAQGVGNAAQNYQNNQFLQALLKRNQGSNPNANYSGQNLGQDDYSPGYY